MIASALMEGVARMREDFVGETGRARRRNGGFDARRERILAQTQPAAGAFAQADIDAGAR